MGFCRPWWNSNGRGGAKSANKPGAVVDVRYAHIHMETRDPRRCTSTTRACKPQVYVKRSRERGRRGGDKCGDGAITVSRASLATPKDPSAP